MANFGRGKKKKGKKTKVAARVVEDAPDAPPAEPTVAPTAAAALDGANVRYSSCKHGERKSPAPSVAPALGGANVRHPSHEHGERRSPADAARVELDGAVKTPAKGMRENFADKRDVPDPRRPLDVDFYKALPHQTLSIEQTRTELHRLLKVWTALRKEIQPDTKDEMNSRLVPNLRRGTRA